MKPNLLIFAVAGAVLVTILGPFARANTIFTVTLNTTPLTVLPGSGAGPFSLAFQLTDGSGTGDGNNTATLNNFSFGGGSASGIPARVGGASGDLSGTVTLLDNSFFNAFVQGFHPGSTLSFVVDLTTNVDSGGTPDSFAFNILDGSGSSIPTLDPLGADTLLAINLDSANPSILTYATDPSRSTTLPDGNAGPVITLAALEATAPAAVPEPTSLLMLVTGLGGLVLDARLRKR